MQEKRTLYLAGKITGDPYYFTKFYNAQKKLEEGGFIVVNPALLPAEGFTWEAYMRMSGALCLQSAPKSVFFRTGKRAKARNMNSAKQWRRTSRFSSSLIGNGRDHRMQKNKMPVPTEAQEQMTLFSWAAMQSGKYPELNLLYHVPNGGSRHKAEAGRLRAEGVKAGVPDLCLPVARGQYHGLYIELKRQRGGRTSDHQSEWLDALSAQGYKAALCYGWEQAAGTIIEYLTGGGTHD